MNNKVEVVDLENWLVEAPFQVVESFDIIIYAKTLDIINGVINDVKTKFNNEHFKFSPFKGERCSLTIETVRSMSVSSFLTLEKYLSTLSNIECFNINYMNTKYPKVKEKTLFFYNAYLGLLNGKDIFESNVLRSLYERRLDGLNLKDDSLQLAMYKSGWSSDFLENNHLLVARLQEVVDVYPEDTFVEEFLSIGYYFNCIPTVLDTQIKG